MASVAGQQGLVIHCFGPPQIALDGAAIKLDTSKSVALVVYLAITGRRYERAALATLLWPEHTDQRGRALLRGSIYACRKALGDRVVADNSTVALDMTVSSWVDVTSFRRLLGPARPLSTSASADAREALELYRDEFLAGFHTRSVNFDDWQRSMSDQLHALATSAFADVTTELAPTEPALALRYARGWLGLDAADEVAHRTTMELLASTGQRTAALRQFQACQRALDTELAVTPTPATVALYEAIRDEAIRDERHPAHPVAVSGTTRAKELPHYLTRFVGRTTELDALRQLLTSARLITLTGAGGVGKTRLAVHLAQQSRNRFADGCYLAELASIDDSALVPRGLAAALGVEERGASATVDLLVEFLKDKRLLLVVDNCEHLGAACAGLLATLLTSVSELQVVTTSRAPLHIDGETIFRVSPLEYPEQGTAPDGSIDALTRFDAIRLFMDRRTAVRPSDPITGDELQDGALLCARLGGLPLAIEIAAARLSGMTTRQVLNGINGHLGVLRNADPSAPTRQRTLSETFDWSYQLLNHAEQQLFCRLAVFAGGFTLEAAAAVVPDPRADLANDSPEGPEGPDTLELLGSLVNKSMVVLRTRREHPRYFLLETMRGFAHDQLSDREHARLTSRHRRWYTALAEQVAPATYDHRQIAAFDQLDTEHDNLRSALRGALDAGLPAAALRLSCALWWFWFVRGHCNDGWRYLQEGLRHTADVEPELLARATFSAAVVGWMVGRRPESLDYARASIALYREQDNACGAAYARLALGLSGQEPVENFERALTALRAIPGEEWGVVNALRLLGVMTLSLPGLAGRAQQLLSEALEQARQVGDYANLSWTLRDLGTAAYSNDQLEVAANLLRESVDVSSQIGNRWGTAQSLHLLGTILHQQEQLNDAHAALSEALALYRLVGAEFAAAGCLVALGAVAAASGAPRRAAMLYGAASAVQAQQSQPWETRNHNHAQACKAASTELGEVAFARAVGAGSKLSLADAAELAATPPNPPHTSNTSNTSTASTPYDATHCS